MRKCVPGFIFVIFCGFIAAASNGFQWTAAPLAAGNDSPEAAAATPFAVAEGESAQPSAAAMIPQPLAAAAPNEAPPAAPLMAAAPTSDPTVRPTPSAEAAKPASEPTAKPSARPQAKKAAVRKPTPAPTAKAVAKPVSKAKKTAVKSTSAGSAASAAASSQAAAGKWASSSGRVAAAWGELLNYKRVLQVTATGYSAADDENGWGPVDYYGNALKLGTIAVDPSVIPMGSKVYITGYSGGGLPGKGMIAYALDQGSAIKGARIDIFIPGGKETALGFGIQSLKVYILK